MAPSANAVKPSGDISLSDTNTPTSPSKGESAGYSLRSGLKAILSTPALKHPIPDISLSDATLEGSGLFADESVTPFSQKNNSIGPLPSKEESVSKPLEKAKEVTERAASPVKNKSKSVIDSTRQRAASTADAAKSTAGSALHTVEDKDSETYAYAKRKAEESLDYAKHAAGDGIKYAKQKTGLAEDQASSSLKEMKDGARKGVAEAKDKASDVAIQAKETAKSARPSSPVKSPIVAEHAGVLESLAGSAKNLAEKLGHAIHHPLGGTHATGAPLATPVTVLPSSPTKSASARTSSARVSSAPKIPTTSGQKVPIGADMEDEEVIFE